MKLGVTGRPVYRLTEEERQDVFGLLDRLGKATARPFARPTIEQENTVMRVEAGVAAPTLTAVPLVSASIPQAKVIPLRMGENVPKQDRPEPLDLPQEVASYFDIASA